MSEENKVLIRRWFEEVWNKGRAEAINEMLAEDAVVNGLEDESGQPLRGPADFRPFFDKFRSAFPDIQVVVEETVAEGDLVAARCTVQGRHQSDSLGFAATARPVEFTGMAMVRVRDGKFVEAWNNFDFMAMFQQLGALQFQEPQAAGAGGDDTSETN